MPVEKINALGWQNVARVFNGTTEVLVTLDVGPRVLSYKLSGGENILRVNTEQTGTSGEPAFVERGGHRLWTSPEDERTYAPDNGPVKWEIHGANGIRVETPAEDRWRTRKEMIITLGSDDSSVIIQHSATNEGTEPLKIASWGLTVMQPGGWEIIPQPPLGEHGKEYLPNRVIVPWTYTDMSDDRWKLGRRFWTLTPKGDRPPTKLGFAHREKWVAYVRGKSLYLKAFGYEDGAEYPDFGCNFETFTKGDLIELESLSPYRTLAPGGTVSHSETWHLFGDIRPPDPLDEAALEQWLQPYLTKTGLA